MAKNLEKKKADSVAHYDSEVDVLYLGLRRGFEQEVVEVAPNVNVELDARGNVLGVEILNASRVLRPVLAARGGSRATARA